MHDASDDRGSFECPTGKVACEGKCVETCLVSLATAAGFITAIAVDAVNVYWLDVGPCSTTCAPSSGRVMSVPKTGGTPTTLASGQSTQGLPDSLVVDDTSVYWIDSSNSHEDPFPTGTLLRIPKAGGTVVTLASHLGMAAALVESQDDLYWIEQDGVDGGFYNGEIMRLPKTGGSPVPFAASGYFSHFFGVLGIDATNVYWSPSSDLLSEPLGGGAVTTLASLANDAGSPGVLGLALDSTSIFLLLERCNGSCEPSVLVSLPKEGGPVSALKTRLNSPDSLVADEASVYWIDENVTDEEDAGTSFEGTVLTVPKAGGAATRLATNQENAFLLAVDSTSLYWTVEPYSSESGCPGEVMKRTPK